MTQEFYVTAKQIGDEIIAISASLDGKMERWSDTSHPPQGMDSTEYAGFINKETATDEDNGISLVVDISAPASKGEAMLRIFAIESKPDKDHIERFNNIQLLYIVNYDKARVVAKKGGDITRDDMREVLHDQDTRLEHVIISNQTGRDQVSGQQLGERYDLIIDEADDDSIDKARIALNTVILALKKSALAESNS